MKLDTRRNYLARVGASIGSTMFQSLYAYVDGKSYDVARGGELSCAIHVSSILTLVSLIDGPHATVSATLRSMQAAGWVESEAPAEGAIVYWAAGSDGHEHIGFWLSKDQVVSNSSVEIVPINHHEVMSDGRRPVSYFIHPLLDT